MTRPGLKLRTTQQLAPQLQQAIRLLQLSTLELEAEVQQMLSENPLLELETPEHEHAEASAQAAREDRGPEAESEEQPGQESTDPAETPVDQDLQWPDEGGEAAENAPDDREWEPADFGGRGAAHPDGESDPAANRTHHESLQEYLHQQALELRLIPEDAAALGYLIESLNDDGYLEDSVAQLALPLVGESDDAEALSELVHRLSLALRLLQTMEPVGVGARNLAECLTLQLRALQVAPDKAPATLTDITTALRICAQPAALKWLARRDISTMAQAVGASEDAARAALALIRTLEPKPGRAFAEVEQNYVVPDVIVSSTGTGSGQKLTVQLNPDVVPQLRVHGLYARILRRSSGHPALGQQLREAQWFIRSVQQRFETILRVAEAIVAHQRAFFTHGELAMRPLAQRELAEELGVHESTISRTTTAKYMATPRGTYELKYFFGTALGADEAAGDAGTSSMAVRALIGQLIAAEDPAHPLSDGRIAELLDERGIACARRTVAKYRQQLGLPVARLRHSGD